MTKKKSRRPPPLPIVPRGTVSDRPVYAFEVGQSIIEALADGRCPEALAVEAHRLLRWKREAIRATTNVHKRRDPRGQKPRRSGVSRG